MGPSNLITDVAGVLVGHAEDARVATGTTFVLFEEPAVASAAVLGGAPGVRETALLEPEMTVERIDGIILSGGSAFGLAAADGAMAALAARGRGLAVLSARVPLVPQAILFDLLNGGNKEWGTESPYRRLGLAAVEAAAADFALGTAGAGYGATTANLKGGIGSASTTTPAGHTLGALVAVNGVGSATINDGPHFWAAPYERAGEYGGLGWPADVSGETLLTRLKGAQLENTTIAVVATDAALTKAQAKRVALAAHDGLARALRPAHLPHDGDTVFAAATGLRPLADPLPELSDLCIAAADTLARAIARGVYEARALPFPGALPSWRDRFGG